MPRVINSIDKQVGQNIRIFREAKGLSQTKLGDAIGVTFQQIQKYEKGTNRIGAGRLVQIAEVLGLPIARIFDSVASIVGTRQSGPVVTDLLSAPYAVDMLQAFSKVPSNSVKRSLVALTQSVASPSKGHS